MYPKLDADPGDFAGGCAKSVFVSRLFSAADTSPAA